MAEAATGTPNEDTLILHIRRRKGFPTTYVSVKEVVGGVQMPVDLLLLAARILELAMLERR
jgi:hypothetical protein